LHRGDDPRAWSQFAARRVGEPGLTPLFASTRRLETLGLAAATARLSRAMQQPARTQERTLQAILESLTDTEIGRRHRVGEIASLVAFRDRVTPTTRDELRFDLERTVAGAPDVLVRGRAVAARATMSAAPRGVLIPVSQPCRGRGARDAAAVWVAGLLRRRPRILAGEVLVLPPVRPPASQAGQVAAAGTRLGHLLDVLPSAIRRRLAIPAAVSAGPLAATLAEGARRRLIMRLGLARDVRLVIGGDPAELATCFGTADEIAETIIRDIRDGTFTCAGDLPRALQRELARRFPADRDRARALARGRDTRDGRLLPVEAWSLEAVACLAQVRPVTLRARLDPWLDPWRRGTGPVVVDLGGLTAEAHLMHGAAVRPDAVIGTTAEAGTGQGGAGAGPGAGTGEPGAAGAPAGGHDRRETSSGDVAVAEGVSLKGRASVAVADDPETGPTIEVLSRPRSRPWTDDDPVPGPLLIGAGPPALESAFHEYVELAAVEAEPDAPERWTFRGVEELQPGVRYTVFVTTSGGLLRTETRDVVEVVGMAGATPLLGLRGRTTGILGAVP
jgi:hypothetical protein